MSSNHNAVLSALAAQLLHVHTSVDKLTGGFNRLKLAIGGALMAGAGVAILDTMAKLVDKTKEYSDELVKIRNLGGPMTEAADSGEIARRAFDISQRVPMKVTDLMKIPGMTYSILGKEEAMDTWETLAKLAFTMQGQKGYHGDPGQDLQKIIRAGELSGRITDPTTGQIDLKKLENYLDIVTRITAATHGMVNPATLLGMAQQGGVAMRGLSDQGFYSMAIAAQAMGGPRAGTAYLSEWQQMAAGTMFTRTAEGMQEMGLLKPDEWHKSGGRVVLSDEASKRLTAMISNDPMKFAGNVIDLMKERGITDPEQQMRAIMRIMNRQTTQRFTAEEVANFNQIMSERERMAGGMSKEGAFAGFMGKSVGANIEGMKNAWDNLLMAVGGPQSERVISVLQSITSLFNSMQRSVTGMSPDTLGAIGKGIGILGLALTGAGGMAILAALGPAGWIAGGLIGLGGVLIAFPNVLQTIKADFSKYADLIKGDFDRIANAISSFVDMLAGIWGKVKGFFGGGASKSDPSTDAFVDGLKKQMRFDPATSGQKREQFAFALNLDGEKVAQTIIDKIEAKYRFDTNTPAFNGAGSYGA